MVKFIFQKLRRLKREQKGTTAIEFAIILPVYILLLVTGIDLAIMAFEQYSLNYAVSYAARYVYLNPSSSTSQVKTYAMGLVPTLPDTVTFSVATVPNVQSTISASVTHKFMYFSHADITLSAQVVQPLSTF